MTPQDALSWWQREDLCYRQGQLFFAGQAVQALANRFGTPSFVYSADRVRANLKRLHAALNGAGLAERAHAEKGITAACNAVNR